MPIRSCIRPIYELFSNCGPPHRKNVHFADSTTNQTSPTHPRAWMIKRSKPIPETTPTTSLTLISSLRSENTKRNKKAVIVKFSFIERAILPNGQVMQSVICFNAPNEYWKPGALDEEPCSLLNCRTTRYNFMLLFIVSCLHFSKSIDLFHLILHFIF